MKHVKFSFTCILSAILSLKCIVSFAVAPTSIAVPANRVTFTGAHLNCLSNPGNETTTISFEYGLTTSYGSTASVQGTISGTSVLFKTASITGLTPGKTYHYRAKAVNGSGTTYGEDRVFGTGSNFNSGSPIASHTLIVGSDGLVYATGNNAYGQLGDNTTTYRSTPVQVVMGAYSGTTFLGDNPANPIIAVVAGQYHSLALAADGTVYSFGYNGGGQLGDNTVSSQTTPVKVLQGAYSGTTYLGDNSSNPIIGIAGGGYHSMALAADGTVFSFGDNSYGQMGDSSTTQRNTAVRVLKGVYSGTNYLGDNSSNPIVSVKAGLYQNLVLAADGTVYGFGYNAVGQLGDNTTTDRNTPIQALKGAYSGNTFLGDNTSNPIISISTGYHSLTLAADGTVFSFGINNAGQLGDNTTTNRSVAVKVVKGAYAGTTYLGDSSSNPMLSVTAGLFHSMVLASNGTAYSFGQNAGGQLGDNTSTNRSTAVKVLKGVYSGTTILGDNAANPLVSILAGNGNSMAMSADGNVFSFGTNGSGQLGDNTTTNRFVPVQMFGVAGSGIMDLIPSVPSVNTLPAIRVTYKTASLNATVNANSAATILSFEYGLTTGYGSTVNVSGTSSGNLFIYRSTGITGLIPGKTYHYRAKATNSLGTTYGDDRVLSTGSNFNAGSPAANHSIVVGSDGIVYVTGYNNSGQIGDSTTTNRATPVRVLKGGYAGTAYLGDNSSNPIIAVAAGQYHSLALAADGTVYSFGQNTSGQLGDNTTTNRLIPVKVLQGAYSGTTYLGDNSSNPIVSIIAGSNHSLALAADGSVYSFGYNATGQLGDNTVTQRKTAVRVLKGAYSGTTYLGDNSANPIISIVAGVSHSFALAADGNVFSFGDNTYGQLGDNTNTQRKTAVRVLKGVYSGTTYLGDYAANPIIMVKSGGYHSLALAANGTVYSFGYNGSGQLGDNTTTNRKVAVGVLNGAYTGTAYLGDNTSNPIVAILAGYYHSLALAADGIVYAYGYNAWGQLGDNTNTNRGTPVQVLKGAYSGTTYLGDNSVNTILAATAGYYHTVVLAADGTVYSVGHNGNGQLGDNTTTNRSTAVQMLSVGGSDYIDLIGCYAGSTLPNEANITYTGNSKETDANGWTHYCDVNYKLLLSLKIGTSGAVVPSDSVRLKLGSTAAYSSTSTGGMINHSDGYAIIDRRWDVSPTTQPNSGNVGVKYYFTAAEYSGLKTALASLSNPSTLSSVTQMNMYKTTSGAAFANPHAVNGIILFNGATPGWDRWVNGTHGTADHSAEFLVSSFSGGGGGGGGGGGAGSAPLPVKLIYFEALAKNNDAQLLWQTASEDQMSHFEVERKLPGGQWESIGMTTATKGQTQHSYKITDAGILSIAKEKNMNTIYYRLKSIDIAGIAEYSETRVLNVDKNSQATIHIYPQPASGTVSILLSNTGENTTIELLDLTGKLVSYQSSAANTLNIDISNLAKGIYMVRVNTDGNVQTRKLLVE